MLCSAATRQVKRNQKKLAPAIISAAKLYEVQKYCSLTNHMWDGWWLLINRRAWQGVPGDVQRIFAKHVNAAAMAQREDVAKQNESLKADLAAKVRLIEVSVVCEPSL